MDILTDNDTDGEFTLDRMPTEQEADYIRGVIKLNKRPNNTPERKQALQQHMNAINAKRIEGVL